MNFSDIFIVIPVYNDPGEIRNVILDLQQRGYANIVAVEDGSTDNTYEILHQISGIHLLHHIVNRGQGAALFTGHKYAVEQGAKYIVDFDADGQHPAEQIPELISALENGYDVVLGSRFKGKLQQSNTPFTKKVTLRIAILLTWFLSDILLSDVHNGFRGMTAAAAQKLRITYDRFEHASEILDLIARHKLSYTEIPVKITYTDYSKQKGQRLMNSVNILFKLVWEKLHDIFFK